MSSIITKRPAQFILASEKRFRVSQQLCNQCLMIKKLQPKMSKSSLEAVTFCYIFVKVSDRSGGTLNAISPMRSEIPSRSAELLVIANHDCSVTKREHGLFERKLDPILGEADVTREQVVTNVPVEHCFKIPIHVALKAHSVARRF